MSWNAAQILKSIKNGSEHRIYSDFATWKTSEGLEVTVKIYGFVTSGWWTMIKKEHEELFRGFLKMTPKEVATIERIILRKLLA